MDQLFSSGHAADLIAALMLAEALWLGWRHRRTGRGIAPRQFLASLAAGLGLVLALRCVLVGAAWPWVALWLAAGGAAHAVDVWQRWRA
jgi:hypothetical protein